jgi:antirestriction protein ArdC
MSRPADPARPDLYTRITDSIIAQLEVGVRPWTQPWASQTNVARPLRHNGEAYSGINVLLLWSEAASRGFQSDTWMTFRQALALGARVRKGEKGATVVYAGALQRDPSPQGGDEEPSRVPFLKAYTVFNVDQIDGLGDRYAPVAAPAINPGERVADAEAFFAAVGADVRHGGGSAYYVLEPDYVQMPPFESFLDPQAYYANFGHELTHWTRHPDRLDRDFGRRRHGDEGYAREELVAELGAAFLCADLGLALEPREDHAAYIGSWLQVLRGDKRFIISAASHAQKAVDHLRSYQT